MSNKEKPVRFIEIKEERVRFYTAHDNHKKRKEQKLAADVTALLEEEQKRLIRTWDK